MKIAVASKGLEVAPHFESCTNYNCYTVRNGKITSYGNMPLLEQQNLSVLGLLRELEIDVLIVGSLRKESLALLEKNGIIVLQEAKGSSKQIVEDYLSDTFFSCDNSC